MEGRGLNKPATQAEDEEVLRGESSLGGAKAEGYRVELKERTVEDLVDEELERLRAEQKVGSDVNRLKSKELATSTCPMEILKRVKNGIGCLRDALIKREGDNGATEKDKEEFEKVFGDASEGIQADLLLLDKNLISLLIDDGLYASLLEKYNQEQRKLVDLNGVVSAAIEGTRFANIAALRADYDEICGELMARYKKEESLQDQILSLRKEIRKAVEENKADNRFNALSELVSNALAKLGCRNLVDVVDETLALRSESVVCTGLLDSLMKEVQVSKLEEIIVAVQEANTHRDKLMERNHELEVKMAELTAAREKLQREKEEVYQENEILKKQQLSMEASESSRQRNVVGNSVRAQVQRLAGLSGTSPLRQQIPRVYANENKTQGVPENVTPSVLLSRPSDYPALMKFNGDRSMWETFSEGFFLRYEHLSNRAAKQILRESLVGRAMKEYDSLPNEFRSEEKSVNDCMEWLRERCSGGKAFSDIDSTRKFHALSVNGRSVDAVCEELEFLTSKLFEGAEACERARKNKLLLLYENGTENLELLRLSEKGEVYDTMKKHLQMVEYLKRRESRTVAASQYGRFDKGARFSSGENCFNCGGGGHKAAVCTSPKWTRNDDGSGENIVSQSGDASAGGAGTGYIPNLQQNHSNSGGWQQNSNTYGGVRRITAQGRINGASDKRNRVTVPRNRYYPNNGVVKGLKGAEGPRPVDGNGEEGNHEDVPKDRPVDNGYHAVKGRVGLDGLCPIKESCDVRNHVGFLRDSKCNVEHASVDVRRLSGLDDPPLFKEFNPVQCIVGGLSVSACLDTGSDVSMIDKRTVNQLSDVRVDREDIPFKIRDAQGMLIKTSGTVVLDVEMDNSVICKVKFAISEVDLPEIILGRGALDDMGLKLRRDGMYIAPDKMGTVLIGDVRAGEAPKIAYSPSLKVRGLYADPKVDNEGTNKVLSERFIQKNCVVLIPDDSNILKDKGPHREIRLMSYADEQQLKRYMKDMNAGNSFPRSLVIIVKSSSTPSTVAAMQEYSRSVVKEASTVVYITEESFESKLKHAESKNAFEDVVKSVVVEGVRDPACLSLESSIAERFIDHAQRSHEGGIKKVALVASSEDSCHYCHVAGHFKWSCPKKGKKKKKKVVE